MGSVSDCYDNAMCESFYDDAMCESFFATLECEPIERSNFRTRAGPDGGL